jgi:hypothetical protein
MSSGVKAELQGFFLYKQPQRLQGGGSKPCPAWQQGDLGLGTLSIHPTTMGYEKVCDLMEAKFEKFPLGVAPRKRPAEEEASQEAKRRKVVVPRPN